MSVTTGPQLFPRIVADHDELGYPLLAHDCPFCGAVALIINEWNAIECLTCSWREFGPDGDRADYDKYPIEMEDDEAPALAAVTLSLLGRSGL